MSYSAFLKVNRRPSGLSSTELCTLKPLFHQDYYTKLKSIRENRFTIAHKLLLQKGSIAIARGRYINCSLGWGTNRIITNKGAAGDGIRHGG